METNTVQMTQEELEQFRAYQAEKARNEAEEKAKEMRESYREMVDGEIESAVPELLSISRNIKEGKMKVLESFKTIIDMKLEMFRMSKGKEMTNQ